MRLTVNGEELISSANTIESLLRETGRQDSRGLAVAINEEVVQRSKWPTTTLKEDDNILILTATQGG